MNRRVRPFTLSGSNQTVGPDNAANTEVYYFGMNIKPATSTVIVTDAGGAVIDSRIGTAAIPCESWYGPNGILCNAPLTVTCTGTVAGSLYLA